jgi:hypothetical protein
MFQAGIQRAVLNMALGQPVNTIHATEQHVRLFRSKTKAQRICIRAALKGPR